jgi:hypothetical protein
MAAGYDQDTVRWASEQARLLRTRQSDLLDLEQLADEIEDLGKTEKRELQSRMAVLLAHLLEWPAAVVEAAGLDRGGLGECPHRSGSRDGPGPVP